MHTTVLLHEAVDALVTNPDGIYVDGTFGRGGHTRELLSRLGPGARVIAIDRDPVAVAAARTAPTRSPTRASRSCTRASRSCRRRWPSAASRRSPACCWTWACRSPQIDTPERGFSFRFDGPLDMRMDTTRGETAADFLARADERQIAEVIRDYGEERFAVSIAKALVAGRAERRARANHRELAAVVARAVKTREPGQDPATRTFQALRIFVNAELEELEQVLKQLLDLLDAGGRLAVISFHSLEDRIVKTFIARESKRRDRPPRAVRAAGQAAAPGRARAASSRARPRCSTNRRARSAILRVAERLG